MELYYVLENSKDIVEYEVQEENEGLEIYVRLNNDSSFCFFISYKSYQKDLSNFITKLMISR